VRFAYLTTFSRKGSRSGTRGPGSLPRTDREVCSGCGCCLTGYPWRLFRPRPALAGRERWSWLIGFLAAAWPARRPGRPAGRLRPWAVLGVPDVASVWFGSSPCSGSRGGPPKSRPDHSCFRSGRLLHTSGVRRSVGVSSWVLDRGNEAWVSLRGGRRRCPRGRDRFRVDEADDDLPIPSVTAPVLLQCSGLRPGSLVRGDRLSRPNSYSYGGLGEVVSLGVCWGVMAGLLRRRCVVCIELGHESAG